MERLNASVRDAALGDTPPVSIPLSVSGSAEDPMESLLPYDTPSAAVGIPSCGTTDMKACLSSAVTPRREHPLTGDEGQLFLRGPEPADAAIDFISSECRPSVKGPAGFAYILLYNETSPAALPAFLALMDSCRLFGEPGAITVASKSFPDPHPTVILNPMTSIIAVR
jgi:hypothetical protein